MLDDDMFSLSIIFLFAFILCTSTDDDEVMDDDNKLVLKPAELAGLVLKERIKSELKKTRQCNTQPTHNTDGGDMQFPDNNIGESDNDDAMLKNRKVWSRWSRWGSCSVSCGSGYMARRRACVAGRCARGEREEQRRPCRRTPCPDYEPQAKELLTNFSMVTVT